MSENGSQKQAGRAAAFILLAACVFMLAACGKKPGKVDAPPYVTNDTFPQTYPDPATDPKP